MELALFPLHVVLFPGRLLPLHIFENRYRTMLADLLEGDRRFGVVAIRAGAEVGGDAEIHAVGTIARLDDVKALPDGRADVLARGERRFRVVRTLPGRPYARAEVEPLEDEEPGADAGALADEVRAALAPYLTGLGAPPELLDRLPADPRQLAYVAASSLQTEIPQQQRLLELDSVEARLSATLRLLRREQRISEAFGTVGSLRPSGPGGCELN